MSSLSEGIAKASSALEAQQANRVRQLAASYQSGHYRVESDQLSRALTNQMLGGQGVRG
jgi:hypothetical protein